MEFNKGEKTSIDILELNIMIRLSQVKIKPNENVIYNSNQGENLSSQAII